MNYLQTALKRFDAYWYAAMPAERLAILRILVGLYALVYLCIRAANLTSVVRFPASHFDPVGPVSVLTRPLAPELVYTATALAILSGVAFVAGFRYRLSGPIFALLFLWVTSYRNSWGMKFHTENLVALHLVLLGLAPAADVLAIGARSTEPQTERGARDGRYGWAIRAMCVVTVATYVLAGIAKLRSSGWDWATGEILRQHIAYDNLRKIELGSVHSPLGALLVRWRWLFPPLAAATLFLELGAPLALVSRRFASVWAGAVWLFHAGVLLLMAIVFPYQLSGIAYLCFFRVERIQELPKFQQLFRRHHEVLD